MTFQIKRSLLAASVTAAIIAPVTGFATNGMNLEGYGPIATGMGGASMAYDNGVAALMNNPATLGLMEDGESRLDVALGNLGPDITSSAGPNDAKSGGDSYFMPAAGYAVRNGQLTYGVGMFAQGGMGTEYEANSFMAAGTGEEVRSEVGVGRLAVPIVYNIDKNLTVGGSIDYVFGGMDLKMAMGGTQFLDFMPGSANNAGVAGGSMVTAFQGAIGAGVLNPTGGGVNALNTARFDFSNQSDISGDAKGAGITGKLGFTYRINKNLTLGGTYHAKTSMDDLETSDATVSMNVNYDDNILNMSWNGIPVGLPGNVGTPAGSYTAQNVSIAGKISVNDFQFPAQFGLGMSYAQDKWMVAADIKIIQWSDVMDSFRMTFTADATQTGLAAGFAGQVMDVEMFQNWDDQTVIQIGGAYKVTADTTLRGGINTASNPVPDEYLNALFPATVETHYTLGVGHALSKMSNLDFSLTIVPEVSNTAASGVVTDHAQMNYQIMYTQKF